MTNDGMTLFEQALADREVEFIRSDFSLRWNVAEDYAAELRLAQQLQGSTPAN